MSSSSSTSDDSTEQTDDAAEKLEPARGNRTFAYLWVTALFVLPIAAAVVAVQLGWVSFDVTVAASVEAGWVLEYLLLGFAALFFLFTAAMVTRIVGVGFVRGVVRAAARIADAYQLPDREDE